ncbi:hypothetical protein GYA13_02420 [Candidatus Kuenenbacteria bacterium]|nr:hypothetical protein [Candidatus Kuenenbacteria bacterium]
MNPAGAGESPKFSSPDETANYFWIKQFATGQPLYYFEELNGPGNNLIHPRSVNVVAGKNVPGSFMGLIFIYGFLAKIFGLGIIPYLTPFFSALGIFFFYLLLKKLFHSESLAVISAVLLSFAPAWFYYACRGMYHNVLFMSLLIMGVYLLWKVLEEIPSPNFKFLILNFPLRHSFSEASKINHKLKTTKSKSGKLLVTSYPPRVDERQRVEAGQLLVTYFLSGLLLGFAIVTRTSEFVWIALTVLLIFIVHFKKIYWPGLILFLAAGFIPLIILFYYNQILYGSLLSAGYQAVSMALSDFGAGSAGVLFQILITPFGLDPKSILTNSFNYLYQLFPLWGSLAFVGAFLFAILPMQLIKINYKKRITYLAYCLLLTAYLLIFYGSWSITDRIDRSNLSLGTSYLRYWLPIYLVLLPLIATVIWQISNLLTPLKKRKTFYQSLFSFLIIGAIFLPTMNVVLRQKDESLFLLKNLSEARTKSALVNKLLGPDDIVLIYKQADKIFFPERPKVITELAVPLDYESVATLAKLRPLYYYTFARPADVASISRRYFQPYGLEIIDGEKVLGTDWLYKLQLTANNKQ